MKISGSERVRRQLEAPGSATSDHRYSSLECFRFRLQSRLVATVAIALVISSAIVHCQVRTIPSNLTISSTPTATITATVTTTERPGNATEEHLILSPPGGYVDFHTETPILLFDNVSTNEDDNSTAISINNLNSTTTTKPPSISSESPARTSTTGSNETDEEEENGDSGESDSDKTPFVPPQNVSQYMDYIERLFHDLRHQISYFFEPHIPQLIRTSQMVELSPLCSHDILRMALALRQLEPWALKMIDSSGKLPEGIFEGSFTSLGSYDQCLNILFTSRDAQQSPSPPPPPPPPTVDVTTTTTTTQGKYCLVNVSPFLPPKPSPFERVDRLFQEEANKRNYSKDDQFSRLSPMFYYMRFRIGICVPSTCDSGDMSSISQALRSSLKLNITVDTCRFKQPHGPLSSQQIVSGSIAACVILLVFAATLLDYWRQSSDRLLRKQKKEFGLMNRGGGDDQTGSRRWVSRTATPTTTTVSKNLSNQFQVITDFGKANGPLGEVKYEQEPCNQPRLGWIWRSFSLIANFKLYFSTSKMRDQDVEGSSKVQLINCLNGIRVISLCWVIVANSYVTLDPRATKGLTQTREAPRDFLFQLIVQASLAIETFFFLSGLLMSLSFSRHQLSDFNNSFTNSETRESRIGGPLPRWLRFYLHRYVRLTAPAMLIIALAMFAHRYGDGPLWHEVTHRAHLSCSANWWRHLLHVANFIDTRQTCFIHFWYIAADMQLFLIGPLLLLLLDKFARLAIFLMSLLSASSIYWIFHTTLVRNLPPTLLFYSSDPESRREYGNTIMTKPYTHLLPYLVGMLLGHWLNITQQRPSSHDAKAGVGNDQRLSNTRHAKHNKFEVPMTMRPERNKLLIMESKTIMRLLGLLASLVVLAEIFLPYLWNNSHLPAPWLASLYAALFRLGWALSLAYLVVSCRHGRTSECVGVNKGRRWCWCGSGGNWLNQFLSWTIFSHLSRLSFIAYLIHLPLMSVFVAQTRAVFAFSHMLVVHLALSYLLMTFMLSFVLVHLVEFPFVTFERYLFDQLTTGKTKPKINKQTSDEHAKSNYTISLNGEPHHQQHQQRDHEHVYGSEGPSPGTLNAPESA